MERKWEKGGFWMDVNENKMLGVIKDHIYMMMGGGIRGMVFKVFLLGKGIGGGGVRGMRRILERFGFEAG